jgi:glycogen debranching enzyme
MRKICIGVHVYEQPANRLKIRSPLELNRGKSRSQRKFATQWMNDFEEHLREACLGQVSEIFDGDAPHTPRGCIAQAWSVAELLRAAVEVFYQADTSPMTGVKKSRIQRAA